METDVACCSICTDELGGDNVCTLSECGHRFHAQCIVNWFRLKRSCPMCRCEGSLGMRVADIRTRCSQLRKRALRKDAPSELKRLVARLRESESEVKDASSRLREFVQEKKTVLKEAERLRREVHRRRRLVRARAREIGVFSHPACPLPLLYR